MPLRFPLVVLLALTLTLTLTLALAVPGFAPRARAQEATPAASPPEDEGVSAELVSLALGVTAPNPADLLVVRIGLEPGAVSPIAADDPNGGMFVVESGVFAVRVEAAWTLTRGAGLAAAMATAEATGDLSVAIEAIAAGEEVTLAAGDAAYIPGNVEGELRNDGSEPAVGLAFLVGPAGGATDAATPAAQAG